MKPKLIIYLALAIAGGCWVVFALSGGLANWVYDYQQKQKEPTVVKSTPEGTWTMKLKKPWMDTKIVLFRRSGEVVQLDAKKAVYTLWSPKDPAHNGKGFDYSVMAFGWTPLIAAIFEQQTNITTYLLTRNVNLNLQDTRGETALMLAISIDDTNTVKLLLDKGADVTITGKSGDAFSYLKVDDGNAGAHRELYLAWLNAYKDKNRSGEKP